MSASSRGIPHFFSKTYVTEAAVVFSEDVKKKEITHIQTPDAVKAVYMTSFVAGDIKARGRVVSLIEETELNSVVIDIKDYTGRVSFETQSPYIQSLGSSEKRVLDIVDFIDELHKKNIYVIGRISAFQDSFLVKKRPDLAVKRKSDKETWKDYKGVSWIDPGAEEMWEYLVLIGKEAYAVGFDELNFDYIRFPSDGNMSDIFYPSSGVREKREVIRSFFSFLEENLRPTGVFLSADLFGMTTTNKDDLNIGQVLEYALPYFDYIDPMVYPSHYPPNFNGYADPNKYPYEVVKFSMDKAVARAIAASTTPDKLRPWLQDFDYGGNYDIAEVKAQIKATYDSGLDSWMLWSPSNVYTRGALIVD